MFFRFVRSGIPLDLFVLLLFKVRHPDGSMEISFPDGSHKRITSEGAEDITFPDGTRVQV